MAAENGVYILETRMPGSSLGHEYRVTHVQGINHVGYDYDTGQIADEDAFWSNIRQLYKGTEVFINPAGALMEAKRIYDQLEIVEFGISFIKIDKEF